jgi:ABC-type transport system involved in cytochrome c biogenesis ATPase subunit
VKITAIQIKGLFEMFDYDIAFPQGENVLIITGPNGFGKTMVLNILFNLLRRQYNFFVDLVFSQLTINFDDGHVILIQKTGGVSITLSYAGTQIGVVSCPAARFDLGSDLGLTTSNSMPGIPAPDEWFAAFCSKLGVHLIREQRLFKEVPQDTILKTDMAGSQMLLIETIQSYAHTLKSLLASYAEKSVEQTQQLDSSYPMRLRAEKQPFGKDEYEQRYGAVAKIQEKLARFGLYRHEQDILSYSDEDKKALTVYLKDLETKLAVFADISAKLELFTTILNERRFSFKTIQISPERGFYFQTSTGKNLELAQLSSGEQHEVVLLYELIFNVAENTLVLIDEPEISLHITWQKEFLDDLLKIIKIHNIQVIVATHSPAIINGRWDLTYNLEKRAGNE